MQSEQHLPAEPRKDGFVQCSNKLWCQLSYDVVLVVSRQCGTGDGVDDHRGVGLQMFVVVQVAELYQHVGNEVPQSQRIIAIIGDEHLLDKPAHMFHVREPPHCPTHVGWAQEN